MIQHSQRSLAKYKRQDTADGCILPLEEGSQPRIRRRQNDSRTDGLHGLTLSDNRQS